MSVPFVDLAAIHDPIQGRMLAAIEGVVRSNRFINGPEVQAFERELAAFLNVPHAVAVSSGSDALVAALMAHDVGPGAEVITTPFTFAATAMAILRVGATPVFADIEPDSFLLDPSAAEACITPRTRAIIPVHLFGRAADMTAFVALARRHGLALIEDAAQAIGAEWEAQRVGGLGDAGCFSFFPAKNLGALGDGGAVTTGDAALADRLRATRAHGSARRYYSDFLGGNFRLDALQAAVLRVKLPELEGWTAARQDNAVRYRELFGAAGIPQGALTLPEPGPGRHVWNQYVVRIHGGRRAEVFDALGAADIGRAVYYPVPLHLQPAFRRVRPADAPPLPVSERVAEEVLALPIAPGLTETQQEEVVRVVARALGASA